ncbi:hypothetical protein SNEBB_001622 [Seison nebaliae]|nr:hypothetical protein SNEBB_001622 [Seison nebaliae]
MKEMTEIICGIPNETVEETTTSSIQLSNKENEKQYRKHNCYNKIHVGNFGKSLNEKSLKLLFQPFGEINLLTVNKSGTSNAHAYIGYRQLSMAEKAVKMMNNHEIKEITGESYCLSVRLSSDMIKHNYRSSNYHNKKPPTICVKNLNDKISINELREMFGKVGKILSVNVVQKSPKEKTVLAFVSYNSAASMKEAHTKFNDLYFMGEKINVVIQR